jgi:hypothetical protein
MPALHPANVRIAKKIMASFNPFIATPARMSTAPTAMVATWRTHPAANLIVSGPGFA